MKRSEEPATEIKSLRHCYSREELRELGVNLDYLEGIPEGLWDFFIEQEGKLQAAKQAEDEFEIVEMQRLIKICLSRLAEDMEHDQTSGKAESEVEE